MQPFEEDGSVGQGSERVLTRRAEEGRLGGHLRSRGRRRRRSLLHGALVEDRHAVHAQVHPVSIGVAEAAGDRAPSRSSAPCATPRGGRRRPRNGPLPRHAGASPGAMGWPVSAAQSTARVGTPWASECQTVRRVAEHPVPAFAARQLDLAAPARRDILDDRHEGGSASAAGSNQPLSGSTSPSNVIGPARGSRVGARCAAGPRRVGEQREQV